MSYRTWIVRAGRDAAFFDEFRTHEIVAIGWSKAGPVTTATSDEELDRLFLAAYPEAKEGARRVYQAQVRRFAHELESGDRVATYDPNDRLYLLGTIVGPLAWREGNNPRVLPVRWTHETLRDRLSAATRNGLGSIATLFRTSEEVGAELWEKSTPIGSKQPKQVTPGAPPKAESDVGDSILREEVAESASQFIEDRIVALSWQDMQDLVAGILRAMGYRTQVATEGSDLGVDIFASPDGLGLEDPRIFVEVNTGWKDSAHGRPACQAACLEPRRRRPCRPRRVL